MSETTASVDPSDGDLVKRVQTGEASAFSPLVDRHLMKIYGFIYHMISNREDAEELAWDVFHAAYKSINGFKGQAQFGTWLHTIARNKANTFIKGRAPRTISLDEPDEGVLQDEAWSKLVSLKTPYEAATWSDVRQEIAVALQKIQERLREVVVLHDLQGMPIRDIARILDIPEKTARDRLFRARRVLHSHLSGLR